MAYSSKYSKALAERICSRIAEGRSLRDVCRDADIPVSSSTVSTWVLRHDDFAECYGRACGLRTETRFEELLELADAAACVEFGDDGRILKVADKDDVPGLRVKVDVLKWALSKMKPEKYSDKLQLEHQGEQAVRVEVVYADADDSATP